MRRSETRRPAFSLTALQLELTYEIARSGDDSMVLLFKRHNDAIAEVQAGRMPQEGLDFMNHRVAVLAAEAKVKILESK